MNGFKVMKDPLKMTENKAGSFNLLVEDEDFEIFESIIKPGRSIICQPYECKDALNVALVISGKLFHTNTSNYILSGERITFKNIEETHHLYVVEESKLLMIRRANLVNDQMKIIEKVSDFLHIIQERDSYTEEHCNRTGNLAVQLATYMKLDEKVIENVLYVGKFHDVGKIDLPGDVLNKPGKLSTEEYERVKTHSQIGHDIVLDQTGDAHFARIVLEHHEKLNGSGYPNGLKGDAISMEARVILVADSFDAMTSDRPYRKAMSNQKALEELKRYSGIWYDPAVVRAMEDLIKNFGSHLG